MHTYTERSRATKTLFPLLANSLLPVPEEKESRGSDSLFRISLALDGFWRILEKVKKKGVC